jgi:hypothetical protein
VPAIDPAADLTEFLHTETRAQRTGPRVQRASVGAVPGAQHLAPSTEHPAPGTQHPASGTDQATPKFTETRLILVEPSAANNSPRTLTIGTDGRPTAATVLIGPEGGWTEDEIRIAEASGFQRVTLGRLTLRADAVPVVAVTTCRVLWNDW